MGPIHPVWALAAIYPVWGNRYLRVEQPDCHLIYLVDDCQSVWLLTKNHGQA